MKYLIILLLLSSCNNVNTPYIDSITAIKNRKNILSMIDRLKDLIVKNFSNKNIEDKNNILLKSRKEVEINGNGTSGYTIKEGSHKGTVLGHIKREKKVIE
jgi:hypothetical protein